MRKLSTDELQRVDYDTFKNSPKLPVVIVLDNIRSQHNIGSVFRTCDAFRIQSIFLCGITATPPNREIQKTALGATESVEWKYFDDTREAVRYLKNEGYQVIAVEQTTDSIPLDSFSLENNKKLAFIFGNEVNGVQEDVIESVGMAVEIPQFGTKHSFNVSVTAGIVIWNIYCLYKKEFTIFV